MKKSLVYTKTGDLGTTGLIGGTRVPKTKELPVLSAEVAFQKLISAWKLTERWMN